MSSSAPHQSPSGGGDEEQPSMKSGKGRDMSGRFFRYFQQEITALQEQMDRLGGTAVVTGERSDALDHCLAGISRLSGEVKDASSYIPAHDQRVYADAIKALHDKLAETKERIAPRPKFSFKTARKNPSAVSLTDAPELAAEGRRRATKDGPSVESSSCPTPAAEAAGDRDRNAGSEAPVVSVDAHTDLHVVLPMPTSSVPVPASITSLQHCAVDMFITASNVRPFAALTVKDISSSLLICGQVNGAAHITNVENSAIVVSCHQFRMHNCNNVDVYLSCSSKPIIEDCKYIKFSKVPQTYSTDPNSHTSADLWSHVEDFKWLKSEPSPNWKLLDDEAAVAEDVWKGIATAVPAWSVDDILKATHVIAS